MQERLQRLEELHSEQDYTIQALSDTVARQDREITLLRRDFEQLKQQLNNLKTDISSDIDPANEKPPHY